MAVSSVPDPKSVARVGGWIGGAGKARRRGIVGAIPRRSNAASVVEPPPNLVTDFGFGTLGRGPALARGLGAALADAHDADARELEVRRERAMRPALGTQVADLPVALRLHAAREAVGQDRCLRDADAEGLRHHPQRAPLPDHLHDVALRRRLATRPDAASARLPRRRRRVAQRRRGRGRVAQQPPAQVRGLEPEAIAQVLEGEGPVGIGGLDPLPRLRGERPALVWRPDLADQATNRVLEDGAHERALTGGRTPLGPDCVFALLALIKHIGSFSFVLA